MYLLLFVCICGRTSITHNLSPYCFAGEKDSSSKEVRRGRSDPSAIILEQLISPIHDLGGSRPRPPHTSSTPAATDKDTDGPLASVSDSALDMRVGI